MEKCNVCGKTALLPEKIGNVNICKVCFLKVGGPSWKRQFEKMEDLAKRRNRALESARRECFPENVVLEISSFFEAQQNTMQKCNCCGAEMQTLYKLGEKKLCKKCYSNLNVESWIETDFDDNDEVEECRKRVLKTAQKKKCPKDIVNEINAFFDSKIEKDLICCIDGGLGQKLKVYADYCILITEEWFDVEESSARYKKAQKHFDFADSLQILGTAASLLSNVIPGGGLVRKGVRAAGSALISTANKVPTKNTQDEIIPLNIFQGKYRIDYGVFTSTDFKQCGDGEYDVGFIRFYKRNVAARDARVFLFEDSGINIEEGYKAICEGMDAFVRKKETEQQSSQALQPHHKNPAIDEIRELKLLLDEGVLTQDEFDFMKKELLGMQSPNQ